MITAQTPKASVVVCTYDRLRIADLEACVASLLGQQYEDFEILVTVDHNKAMYDTLARKFEHSKVKVVPNDSKKRGQASTMNCGLSNSHGEIVCFIDDDAIASKEWLWTLVSGYDRSTLGVGAAWKLFGWPRNLTICRKSSIGWSVPQETTYRASL